MRIGLLRLKSAMIGRISFFFS